MVGGLWGAEPALAAGGLLPDGVTLVTEGLWLPGGASQAPRPSTAVVGALGPFLPGSAEVIAVLWASGLNSLMGSQVPAASRCRDPGPIFGEMAPAVIEDTLIQLATENEQYLSELPDQAGCFKETQIVGEMQFPSYS